MNVFTIEGEKSIYSILYVFYDFCENTLWTEEKKVELGKCVCPIVCGIKNNTTFQKRSIIPTVK